MNDSVRKLHIAIITPFTACLLLCAPTSSNASGNAESGQVKATVCKECHGNDGQSVDPSYPNLAGQHESYLIKALSDYRSGRRQNPIMAGFSANLTNQDIEDLAAWYASQAGLEDLSIK
jgi:cytochrome c553